MHLYDNSELNWHLENGADLKVAQKTNYPWDGGVDIAVSPAQPSEFHFLSPHSGMGGERASRGEWQVRSRQHPGQYLPISAAVVSRATSFVCKWKCPYRCCRQTRR